MSETTVRAISRAETYYMQERLESEACSKCGILFAAPATFIKRRREDDGTFYCPNGHSLWFGANEIDKLRARLEHEREATARTREDLAHERKQHSATKGKLTKTINRAKAGVCPFCTRTFQQVQRHIDKKHSERTDS